MKVIIAGSRSLGCNILLVSDAVRDANFEITEVVCGEAPGIDTAGRKWAQANKVHIQSFPAKWGDTTALGAVIKKNLRGISYNVKAGFDRNIEMAKYADALIAIQAGSSPGTEHMIKVAKEYGLQIYVKKI